MTAHVFRAVQEAADVPLEQSLAKLDEQFGRAYYDRPYRGAYLGRPLALHARDVAELYAPPLRSEHIAAELGAIYPQALSQDLARLKALEEDKATLQGLKQGIPHGERRRHSLPRQGSEARRSAGRARRSARRARQGARGSAGTRPALPGRASRGSGPARVWDGMRISKDWSRSFTTPSTARRTCATRTALSATSSPSSRRMGACHRTKERCS